MRLKLLHTNHTDATALAYERWRKTPFGKEVFEGFCEFADEALKGGMTQFGAQAVVERLRWEKTIASPLPQTSDFKVRNDFTPLLAREYMILKDRDGFFRMRVRKGQPVRLGTLPFFRSGLPGLTVPDPDGIFS
jgi:hypothetical protein